MPRFKAGDRVRIAGDTPSPFANLEGTVQEVSPHERSVKVLDRYSVMFAWGEVHWFYDVQLSSADVRRPIAS